MKSRDWDTKYWSHFNTLIVRPVFLRKFFCLLNEHISSAVGDMVLHYAHSISSHFPVVTWAVYVKLLTFCRHWSCLPRIFYCHFKCLIPDFVVQQCSYRCALPSFFTSDKCFPLGTTQNLKLRKGDRSTTFHTQTINSTLAAVSIDGSIFCSMLYATCPSSHHFPMCGAVLGRSWEWSQGETEGRVDLSKLLSIPISLWTLQACGHDQSKVY